MTETPKRGGIYLRMSKSKGEVKIEQQEKQCRALAAANGIDVTRVYVDDGFSAFVKEDKRPGWQQLEADVLAGEVDVLLAQAEDRFARQPGQKEVLMLACRLAGITWLTVNDGTVDLTSANDEFFAGLRGNMARMESRIKSKRQRDSNDHHAEHGGAQRGGVRPFGYDADKVTLRENEAALIRQAYADYLGGSTVSSIATTWNGAGVLTTRGTRWDINKVQKILRRERNARLVRHRGAVLRDENGDTIKGKWKGIVEESTYLAAVAKLDSRPPSQGRLHAPKFLLSGIATCGVCGLKMRSVPDAKKETRYRCTVHDGQGLKEQGVRHVNITVAEIEPLVRAALVSAVMFAPSDSLSDHDTDEVAALTIRRAEVQRGIVRLVEAVEAEIFTLAEVATKKRALTIEAKKIDARILEITERSARAAILADTAADLWTDPSFESHAAKREAIGARFDALPLEQRRTLVRSLLTVKVEKGRGPDRVKITHLVATSLNEDTEDVA